MSHRNHRTLYRRRLCTLHTGCNHCHRHSSPSEHVRRRVTKLQKKLHDLTEELALNKQALYGDASCSDAVQTQAYRSLWYLAHNCMQQLEELLVSHLGEDVVRPYLPYHAKFRELQRDEAASSNLPYPASSL
ncbi:hypothetical protein C8Q70DRAFT_1055414 [Cubamyces menziesii]|nr:hypothetical protein C8Q70DRAFT_1055414 [Cubamyces menziesii]